MKHKLHCVECNYSTDSRGDANEHEFGYDHHVMDKAQFMMAAGKLNAGLFA